MGPIFNEKVAICPLKCLLQQRKKEKKRENAGNAMCIQTDTRGPFRYNLFLLKLKIENTVVK